MLRKMISYNSSNMSIFNAIKQEYSQTEVNSVFKTEKYTHSK